MCHYFPVLGFRVRVWCSGLWGCGCEIRVRVFGSRRCRGFRVLDLEVGFWFCGGFRVRDLELGFWDFGFR
jgi:hypothetical protein